MFPPPARHTDRLELSVLESFGSNVHVRCTGTAEEWVVMVAAECLRKITFTDSLTHFSWQVLEPGWLHRPTFFKRCRVKTKVDWIKLTLIPASVLVSWDFHCGLMGRLPTVWCGSNPGEQYSLTSREATD